MEGRLRGVEIEAGFARVGSKGEGGVVDPMDSESLKDILRDTYAHEFGLDHIRNHPIFFMHGKDQRDSLLANINSQLRDPILFGVTTYPRNPDGYLSNGSRLYFCGNFHEKGGLIEIATAETSSSRRLAAEIEASKIMLWMMAERETMCSGQETTVFFNNTDGYVTHAYHTNFEIEQNANTKIMDGYFKGFNAALVAISGAGVVRVTEQEVTNFEQVYDLSQRVGSPNIKNGTTYRIADFFTTKGTHRMHVFSEDASMSNSSIILTTDMADIVLRLIEETDEKLPRPTNSFEEAHSRFSRDPYTRLTFKIGNEECKLDAFEVLDHIGELAHKHFGSDPDHKQTLKEWEELVSHFRRYPHLSSIPLNEDDPTIGRIDHMTKRWLLGQFMDEEFGTRDLTVEQVQHVRALDLAYHDVDPRRSLSYDLSFFMGEINPYCMYPRLLDPLTPEEVAEAFFYPSLEDRPWIRSVFMHALRQEQERDDRGYLKSSKLKWHQIPGTDDCNHIYITGRAQKINMDEFHKLAQLPVEIIKELTARGTFYRDANQ